jgi:hypothetical protein
MSRDELIRLADRAEAIALNMTGHAFPNPIEWEPDDLVKAASAFTVAAALRAKVERMS